MKILNIAEKQLYDTSKDRTRLILILTAKINQGKRYVPHNKGSNIKHNYILLKLDSVYAN